MLGVNREQTTVPESQWLELHGGTDRVCIDQIREDTLPGSETVAETNYFADQIETGEPFTRQKSLVLWI